MPRPIGVIQKPGLSDDILSRLGVNRPGQPFILDGDVVPVILIDSGVAFVAAPTPAYGVDEIFTAGAQIAPPAGTRLADTGALPTGSYTVLVNFHCDETAAFDMNFRNATDTGNLRAFRFRIGVDLINYQFSTRFLVENAGERFIVVNPVAGTAGFLYDVQIFAKI